MTLSNTVKNETSERVNSEQDKLCTSMKAEEYKVCDILDQNSTERKQTQLLTKIPPGDTDAKAQVR